MRIFSILAFALLLCQSAHAQQGAMIAPGFPLSNLHIPDDVCQKAIKFFHKPNSPPAEMTFCDFQLRTARQALRSRLSRPLTFIQFKVGPDIVMGVGVLSNMNAEAAATVFKSHPDGYLVFAGAFDRSRLDNGRFVPGRFTPASPGIEGNIEQSIVLGMATSN